MYNEPVNVELPPSSRQTTDKMAFSLALFLIEKFNHIDLKVLSSVP